MVILFHIYCGSVVLFSQHTGRVFGVVTDKDTEYPLAGANIVLVNGDTKIGDVSNEKGEFLLVGIPVGRHSIQVSFIGYNTAIISNVDITSGRNLQLNITLEPMVYLQEEVVVRATLRKEKPQNEMALISARTFSVEETEKFAGSFGDPARMATSFAGVMQGGDQLNEIIIRGNSPAGLLYKLDGFSIPNPTHFSSAGTSGGAISLLNSNTLSNSDFYTGAFPAEFGNALSGVFDLKLRRGNNHTREYLFQMGFNGFEVGLEGPFSRTANSSYLVNYRYSTLEVFDWLGLSLPVTAIPYFQDITAHTHFPFGRFGTTSVFLVAGKNHIKFERERELNIINNTHLGSATAVLGVNHTLLIGSKFRITAGLALTHRADFTIDTTTTQSGSIVNWYGHNSWEQGIQSHITTRFKIDNRNTLSGGVSLNYGEVSLADSVYFNPLSSFIYTTNIHGDFYQVQAQAQHKHRFNDDFSMVTGVHFQHFSISNSNSFEPRLAFSYDIDTKNTISLGVGMHSQIQPRHIYFVETLVDTANAVYRQTNNNLGLSKSNHAILSHQHIHKGILRIKTDIYYQYLHNIPVERKSSYFSMLNYGSFGLDEGSNTDSLVNGGIGYNFGIEFTAERFLTRGWYGLFTASLFESKYKGSDNVWRNTLFNSNFVFNLVAGYEVKISVNHRLSFDVKSVWAGGLRQLPIDLAKSIEQQRTVYDYPNAFDKRFGDYFRLDIKASLKLNFSKVSHVISAELMNSTNRKNHFIQNFNPRTGKIEESTQLGLTPVAMYRFVF